MFWSKKRTGLKPAVVVSLLLSLLLSLSAVTFAAAGHTYIGFTSDVHENVSALGEWLTSLKNSGISELDRMIFGGDYTGASRAGECVQKVEGVFPGTESILVRGNHDTANSIFKTGLVFDGSDYAVYVMDSAAVALTPTTRSMI